MSHSYILHDVMRKVKADGLFDSIRRDLISDIEQKPSYLDLKSQIESLMSSYLSDHKWSSSLKKSDIRERARRHIETSNLIKDTLPSLVNQYMQTCQDELVQPRLSSFVSDHLDHIYHSIGGTHIYRPTTSFTQSISVQQESVKQEQPIQPTIPVKKEPIPPKTPTSNVVKQKIIPKKKPLPVLINPIKEEKKIRTSSPLHSPNELVDISPSPPSNDNERAATPLTPSPPPPVVRVASPLRTSSNTDITRKTKRLPENNDEKKKKVKTEDVSHEKTEDVETDSRKLRSRRPNPKYLNEQFETDDLNILEPSSPPTISKTKKNRHLKSSTSFDTPSSPPPAPTSVEASASVHDMSPEYGTSLPSPTTEKQQIENIDEQSRTPSPVTVKTKKTTSPRRLRPRRAHERSSIVDNQTEKTIDLPARTSSKTRESSRHHRTEQIDIPSTSDDIDLEQTTMKKTRHPSSSGGDNSSTELPSRSISVPDDLNITADDTPTSPVPVTAPVSKSFIWKPKISK